ncbi:hypothetical protein Q5752_000359 [Cryptotrichosporon argae]
MTSTANAKFAHRLRSTDPNGGDATLRPSSQARRSLPPAMAARPVALGQGEKTANARPAWNASTRPVVVRDKAQPTPSTPSNRAPSVVSTRKVVRPVLADGRSRVGAPVERVPGAREVLHGKPAGQAGQTIKRPASDDGSALAGSALGSSAGVWRAYEKKVERGGLI